MPTRAGRDTRTNPEMPKRPKETPTPNLEASSLQQKRNRLLPGAQPIRVTKTPVPTQNHGPARNGAGKLSQRAHSLNQNGSARTGSPDPRGKTVRSPEVEQSSRTEKSSDDNCLVNGDTPEVSDAAADVHSASSSSTGVHPEEKIRTLESEYAGLRISDGGSGLPNNHRAMLLSGQTLPEAPQSVEPFLPPELVDHVLGLIPRPSMHEVIRLRAGLGKDFRNAIHRPTFCRSRLDSEGEFSPSYFMTDDEGDLHWHGFDTLSRVWRRLPSLNFAKIVKVQEKPQTILPSPDPDLFKDYLVAGDRGLLCINVGKAPGREKLVMCNPLTQQVKVLPPLNYARHPVLMHLKVDDNQHYKVFVAGSAAIGTEELSLKTEVYDSRRGVWECPENSDLPCPPFGLNEYQNGIYFRDLERELLMCVAIVDTRGRGVLMYDITKKKWVQDPMKLHIPLVRSEPNVSHLATTQIVECGGFVFVFSEQECGRDVYFLIHKLIPDGPEDFTWDEVMRRKRIGGRGLLVYPEFTCVPISEHELCIFNTVEHTIEIIDLNNPTEVTPLQAAPISKGNRFHSLNPIGFVFKPSFRSVVCPRGCNVELRCDPKLREYCSECVKRVSSQPIVSTVQPKNVCPKVINPPAFIEEDGSTVVTAPTQETHMSTDLVETDASTDAVESGGSEKPHHMPTNQPCGLADEGERKRRNNSDEACSNIVF